MESQGSLKVGEEVRGVCYENEVARCEAGGREQEPGVWPASGSWKGPGNRFSLPRVSQMEAASQHLGVRPWRPASHF